MSEPRPRPRTRKGSVGQSIGGVLFGFEQQVWRNVPPPHELVHHARPDDPVPAGDGTFLSIALPTEGEAAGEDDGAEGGPIERAGVDAGEGAADGDRRPGPDRAG